ncbi:PQQ-dependent sugar dehydrogenase [Cyanobium sp. N5-Cardenillas]|uniref:PQQ-dependent sugar dehydrogenase n=1 Tax=Cyanobium sp. N5-Cardenillas TaxID=2823720 RepID=UPI0020CDC3C9|nr:PQQ-dependent sugar dehydrogenase [Cyanobium sp. N5-Cardenillas]MCP9784733.1 PQQ-dependent sugar dehydrogenase [Cyanobium sp. N5-Cardenillas]
MARRRSPILNGLAALLLVPALLGGCQPAAVSAAVRSVPVVGGLEHPWAVAWLPDGDLLITERPGRLRLVRGGVLQPEPIRGVPEVLAAGQGGLLDVAVHPDFATNRWIYLTYAAGSADANHTRLARARFDGQALTDLQVLFAVPQRKAGSQHFGSRLLWLPDRTLLLAIGDGGNPPVQLEGALIRLQAQNPGSALGKVLRLNDDGSPAGGTPFAGRPNALPGLWSLGHRNIQGLALDRRHGRVWASEHGARGGDELNRIEAGVNYGWPTVTHSREYFGPAIAPASSAPGLRDPALVWTPAIAPSGLALYDGDRYPGWHGDLFAGGLVSQQVHRLRPNPNGSVTPQQQIPIGNRVRDVRQGPDGFLYVLTDGAGDGQLLRLEPLGPR